MGATVCNKGRGRGEGGAVGVAQAFQLVHREGLTLFSFCSNPWQRREAKLGLVMTLPISCTNSCTWCSSAPTAGRPSEGNSTTERRARNR